MAASCLHLLQHHDGAGRVYVDTGSGPTIEELASLVADAVGFAGEATWGMTSVSWRAST
jgi:GDP-L-fucose synthase